MINLAQTAKRPAVEGAAPEFSTSELSSALSSCRAALIGIAVFSGVINLLMLTGSLFMLEVYDRVLPSRSVPTLVGLAAITALLFAFQGLMEITRGRMLVRIGNHLDARLSARIFDLVARLPLRTKGSGDGLQPVRDLDTIRSVMSGSGPTALFDLPWLPLYLAICFAFHPLIGLTTLGGAIVLVGLTCADGLSFAPARKIGSDSFRRPQPSCGREPAQRRSPCRDGDVAAPSAALE